MSETHRSGCPLNLPLEIFGDERSLHILRDTLLPGGAAAIGCAIVGRVCGPDTVIESLVLAT